MQDNATQKNPGAITATEATPNQRIPRFALVLQVMNDVVFPSRLDLGVHALGETVRRTVKMVCKVGAKHAVRFVRTRGVQMITLEEEHVCETCKTIVSSLTVRYRSSPTSACTTDVVAYRFRFLSIRGKQQAG